LELSSAYAWTTGFPVVAWLARLFRLKSEFPGIHSEPPAWACNMHLPTVGGGIRDVGDSAVNASRLPVPYKTANASTN
jgi:hypothetical protein